MIRKLLAAAALACIAAPGFSAIITTVDRATFQSAIGGGTIFGQNFDSLAHGTVLDTLDGVTYSASGGSAVVTGMFLTTTAPNGLGSTSAGFFTSLESATFTFASPISAFAIDINTFAVTDGAYRANLSTGDLAFSRFEVFPSAVTGQFLGFVSDTAFSSLTLSALTGFSYTLDSLAWGNAEAVHPVPEPTSLMLLAAGLAGFGLRRFRRKGQAAG